mmetsp:Transcript_62829/g.152971  ORF Transcript_62829/g.152971 Transcript_62829/m.152971 type:complete len:631 (-) Transcript_62829:152-2044(-)
MAMAASRIISYVSILGLSSQSGRFNGATKTHLEQMATLMEESASLQLAATEADAIASEKTEDAASLKVEADELRTEAAELRAKAKADATTAEAAQIEADATETDIAAEQGEAAAHAAVAATDETIGDANLADGTADAAEAARIEASAHGEEIGIAMCELIPLVDLLCDTVGGVSAVAMEAGAAAEAAKSSGELLAAAAAKAEEERESAHAAELEAKATEDELLATKLEQDAEMESEKAEEEQTAAVEKEVTANDLLEEATVDEDAAAEETATAETDEAESTNLSGQLVRHGVLACWNAILAGVCGIISFGYFFFKIITNFVIPSARQSVTGLKKIATDKEPATSNTSDNWRRSLQRDASYCIQHCAIFVVVAFFYHHLLENLESNSLRARGGILLCFAVSAALVQTFSLHIIPNSVARAETIGVSILHFIRRMLVLPCLFLMEIMILWVVAGSDVFMVDLPRWIAPTLAGIASVTLVLHLICLELPLIRSKAPATRSSEATVDDLTGKEMGESDHYDLENKETHIYNERHSLLPKSAPIADLESDHQNVQGPSWLSLIWEETLMLQPLLEILVIACVSRIMVESLSSIRYLWPTTKEILVHSRPDWLLPASVGLGAALVIVCMLPFLGGR